MIRVRRRALADETGLAILSVEYRRVGEEGGGWPGTFLDAVAALDFVEELSTASSGPQCSATCASFRRRPAAHLPLGVPQVLVAGTRDRIAAAALVRAYATKARAAGDTVSLVEVPSAGHFELVTPGSRAWPAVREAFRDER